MINNQFDKNCLYDTNFSYDSSPKDQTFMKTSRTISNLDKQNVIPCGAQIQAFVSSLNQKKHHLKSLFIEKQKIDQIINQQTTKLDNESIKQSYEIEKQMELHNQNTRTLQQVQNMKRQKLKSLQRLMGLKKSLLQRFQQMVQMKKLVSDLQEQNTTIQAQIQTMNGQNQSVQDHVTSLDLMNQNLDNELLHMRQTVRQSHAEQTTVQTALTMFKNRIDDTLNSIKCQNKTSRQLNQTMGQVNDKIKKLREQKAEYDINSNEFMIRNHHIQDTNIKLRNDLQKCKNHLQCVMKNNEVLTNSIQEFTYVDQRVTKIIRKNQLKKL